MDLQSNSFVIASLEVKTPTRSGSASDHKFLYMISIWIPWVLDDLSTRKTHKFYIFVDLCLLTPPPLAGIQVLRRLFWPSVDLLIELQNLKNLWFSKSMLLHLEFLVDLICQHLSPSMLNLILHYADDTLLICNHISVVQMWCFIDTSVWLTS
jgi:hypothetical protein